MNKKEKRRRILRESILTALTTLLLLGASLLVFAWFHHARPAKGQSAGIVVASPTPYAPESPGVPAPSPSGAEASALPTATPAPLDLMAAYGDRFSPQEQKSENGYTGANCTLPSAGCSTARGRTPCIIWRISMWGTCAA